MNRLNQPLKKNDRISIEISSKALVKALSTGQVSACDIRGLDINAKQSLWHLCLEACRLDLSD